MLPVSVVIPAYNSARYIRQAVASVLEQTAPVSEIIVIDDGSEDDLPAALGVLASQVTCFRQQNAGPAAARNRGVAMAKQEWIAFLDADDYWVPDKLAAQFAELAAHPGLCMVVSDMAEVDAQGTLVIPSMLAAHGMRDRFVDPAMHPVKEALTLLLNCNFVPTGTVLVRRSAVVEAGGFPDHIRYGEDLALWAKIAAKHPIACLPEVHMYRRKHNSNVTRAGSPLYADLARVVDDISRWGHDRILAEGHQPERYRASAWADAGYSYFLEENYPQARAAFTRSLSARLNLRALAYFCACLLPPTIIQSLRTAKARLGSA